jgi:hypothetical protein
VGRHHEGLQPGRTDPVDDCRNGNLAIQCGRPVVDRERL